MEMKKTLILILAGFVVTAGCARKRYKAPSGKTQAAQPQKPVKKQAVPEPNPVPVQRNRPVYPKNPVKLQSMSRMGLTAQEKQVLLFLGSAALGKRALGAIKAMGKTDGAALLAKALRWTNPNGRIQAAIIAAKLNVHDKKVLELMRESLLRDPDPDCRSRTAAAFVDLKDKAAGPALLAMLAHDPHPMARANAAWALGALRYRPAVDELIRHLDSKDTWVRLRVASALKKLRSKKAARAIRDQLKKEKNPLVRKRLRQALKACEGHK